MKIHSTVSSSPPAGDTESLWVYNGLDACLTLEVFEAIEPKLNEITRPVYEHELALQAPILEMELRGIRVDRDHVREVAAQLEIEARRVKENLQTILREGLGYELSFDKLPHYLQLQHLFYETLGLTPVRKKGKITTDRSALEKLRAYFIAEPLVAHILTLRDIRKQLGVLYTSLDSDGRMRTSINIAGTETGRLSSYESAFGTGTNQQNITEKLRKIFIADPGKKLAYIDLEQAEARAVGAIVWNLFHDGTYLDFCESGDLHTNVVKMTWPYLAWTGDPAHDKSSIAGQKFYREFSYRDAAKRLGHGTNYHGQPPQMAKETRIPQGLVSDFQRQYFGAFPGIDEWHKWVSAKLKRDRWITTFMGRQRWFFGRPWDNEVLNAAIAYEPQSCIADYINRGLLALWRACQTDPRLRHVNILLQVHDALLIQYPEGTEDIVVPLVQSILEWEVPLLHGRSLIIPTEAQTGWNWAKTTNEKKELVNPNGIVKFAPGAKRTYQPKPSFMDRRL